jgi:hypothetical protein
MMAVLLLVSILLDPAGNFHVVGWPDAARVSVSKFPEVLAVRVGDGGSPDVPPLIGTYTVEHSELVFRPRYALQPGLTYTAIIRIPGQQAVTQRFVVARNEAKPITAVDNIYPSAPVLPENLLKFYIYFSGPMSRGEAYRHIHLLDAGGQAVPLPFLELNQELWDPESRRFTLYFDPGRIKSGLLPNRESGLPIQTGREYTLVIDRDWHDANGRMLKETVSKKFQVGPAERKPLDVSGWGIVVPHAESNEAVIVEFRRPLDCALLEHEVEVLDSAGNPVGGIATIDNQETRWRFVPDATWKPGAYRVRFGELLADVSGNMLNRPFELDRFDTQAAETNAAFLPFQVRGSN